MFRSWGEMGEWDLRIPPAASAISGDPKKIAGTLEVPPDREGPSMFKVLGHYCLQCHVPQFNRS